MNEIEFDLMLSDSISEDVSINSKGGTSIKVRVRQSVEGKSKQHSTNVKVYRKDKSKNIQLFLDPDTLLIDKKRSEKSAKTDKEHYSLYKDTVDIVGGALLFARDEFKRYFEAEKNHENIGEDIIEEKLDKYSELMNSNDPEFKKYYNYSRKGISDVKESQTSFFDGIELV